MSRPSMNLFSDWPVVKWRSTHRGGITSKANGAEPLSLPVEGRDCGPFFLPEPAFLHRYFSVTARARDNPGVAIYLLFIVGVFYFFRQAKHARSVPLRPRLQLRHGGSGILRI